MYCPICKSVNLVMSERHGIEIDYCPQCRGIWLDRGELDKIIDRSLSAPSEQRMASVPSSHTNQPAHSQDSHSSNHNSSYKKREGFLSDLFDF